MPAFPTHAENKSGVEPQVISLPKGPGSVEGLGESFEPQLNTGTATYRVKIAVSPGVNKHQPEAALEYNSGYGNSPLGIGWDLNTPAIQRRTDKGIPDYTDADTFTYSRSGEMVLLADGTHRLKVEGLFMRFRKSGDAWEAWEKDGTHLYFGTARQSRQGNPFGTFRWYLEKSVDTNGNEIRYLYTTDNGQLYLTEIRYSIMSDAVFKAVSFIYEQRPDPFTDYRSRSRVLTSRRLTGIEVRSQGNLVRKYALSYQPGSNFSLLAKVTQYGTDGATALPPLSFEYTAYRPDAAATVIMSSPPPSEVSLKNGNADLVDIDGDSLPDLVHTSPLDGNHYFYLNRGKGAWGEFAEMSATSPPYLLATTGVQMADMDGNGLADLFVKNSFDFGYYRNKGGLTWEESDWIPCSPRPDFSFEGPNVRQLDVNNDGLIDVVMDSGSSYYVWLNRKDNRWSTTFDFETRLPGGSHLRFVDPHVKLGDMNGDRIEDLVFIMDGYASHFPGKGNGEFDAEVVIANPPTGIQGLDDRLTLADINNDGFADLVLVGNGSVTVWFNAGNDSFAAPRTFDGTPDYLEGSSAFRFADMNGDGLRDLLITNDNAANRFQYVDFSNGVQPNLLAKISNGLGMETSISYAASTDYYLADRDTGSPWATKLPFPVHVVSGIGVKDLNSGHTYRTDYEYRDGYYDGREKEFRGFGAVRKIEYGDATAPTLTTAYRFSLGFDDVSSKGMVLSTETLRGGQQPYGLFDMEENTIESRLLLTGVTGTEVRYSFIKAKGLLLFELNSPPVQVYREFGQDNYGNTTKDFNYGIVNGPDRGAGKDELLTTTTYYYDIDKWVLDRPDTVSKTDLSGRFVSSQRNFYDSTGGRWNLIRQESSPEGTTFIPLVRNQYDSNGNITRITDANDHSRAIGYDPTFHTFPVSETIEGLNLSMSAGYDYGLGVVTSLTDFNENRTGFGYDPLGRLTAIVKSGDSDSLPTQQFVYLLSSPVSSVTTRSREVSGAAGTYDTISYYDGLGRKLQTRSEGTAGKWVVADGVSFNQRKGIARKWLPYFAASSAYGVPEPSQPFTALEYDAKGRSVREANPDTSFRSTVYQPLTKVVYDEEDNRPGGPHADTPHTFVTDGLERLVEVRERNGSATYTTRYEYDGLDNLTKITDNEQNVKTMFFDGLGRKRWMDDPDKHHMAYSYDPAGNLLSTTDAKSQTVGYTYDAANRILTENFNGVKVRYHYDTDLPPAWPGLANTRGKLAWVEDEAGREYYSYDRRGNTEMKVREAAGFSFVNRMGYDAMDRLVSFTYPDGTVQGNVYNAMNLIESIPGYVTAIDYEPSGQKRSFRYANGIASSYGYDSRQRLTSLLSDRDGVQLQNLRYDYDKVSNVSAITDSRLTKTPEDRSGSYVYDDLYRLTTAQAGGAGWTESYQYSSIGNMTFKSDIGTMTYGANGAGPHALTRAVGANIGYGYDANGNISTKTPGFTYQFDHRDRLKSAHRTSDGADMTYSYDYKGNRVTKTVSLSGASATTVYADKFTELRSDRLIRNIFAGDRLVARVSIPYNAGSLATPSSPLTANDFDVSPKDGVITPQEIRQRGLDSGRVESAEMASAIRIFQENREANPALLPFATIAQANHELHAGDAVLFYLPDHLGSASVVTDASGNVVEESVFYPYGADRKRNGPFRSEYRFTGKELDDETGLHYFGARYYDSLVGRFVGLDPIYVELHRIDKDKLAKFLRSSQNHNMYNYVSQNPLIYIDPDGLEKVIVLANTNGSGHAAMLVEYGGKYHYYSKVTDAENGFDAISSNGIIETKAYSGDNVDEVINSVNSDRLASGRGAYNDSYAIDISEEQARNIYWYGNGAASSKEEYKLLTKNCQDFVREALYSAGIITDNKMKPKSYIDELKSDGYVDVNSIRMSDVFNLIDYAFLD